MRTVALSLLLAASAATSAGAQLVAFAPPADTAVGVRPGSAGSLPIIERSGYTVSSIRLVLNYDPSKIQVVGLDTLQPGFASLGISFAPGHDTIIGSGFANGALFGVRYQLQAGVTDGTWIWARPDTMLTTSGDRTDFTTSVIGQICHATDLYGDVDQDGQLDSRDALITLSAAVGLPVTGFAIAQNGDMDGDGLSNSRDALVMLSAAIGVPTGQFRPGQGVPDACPGLQGLGEEIVYYHSSGSGTDSLFRLPANTTTASFIPNTANPFIRSPRLAPNGTDIAYVCQGNFGTDICQVRTDGSGFAVRTAGLNVRGVDWFPSMTQLAFRDFYTTYKTDSAFTTTTALVQSHCCSTALMVRRDGLRVAFDWSQGLGDGDAGGTGQFGYIQPQAYQLTNPRWLPGDSILAARRSGYPAIYLVRATGGLIGREIALFGMNATTDMYDVGAAGYIVGIDQSSRPGLWFVPFGGGALRRLSTDPFEQDPSLRRAP